MDPDMRRSGSTSSLLANAGNRCADHHFPRSRATVGGKGIGSNSVQVCVLPKGVEYRRRCPPHCLGLIAALHHCSSACPLLHHLGILISSHKPPPMLDAFGLRPTRCSASPAALTCPIGGVA